MSNRAQEDMDEDFDYYMNTGELSEYFNDDNEGCFEGCFGFVVVMVLIVCLVASC